MLLLKLILVLTSFKGFGSAEERDHLLRELKHNPYGADAGSTFEKEDPDQSEKRVEQQMPVDLPHGLFQGSTLDGKLCSVQVWAIWNPGKKYISGSYQVKTSFTGENTFVVSPWQRDLGQQPMEGIGDQVDTKVYFEPYYNPRNNYVDSQEVLRYQQVLVKTKEGFKLSCYFKKPLVIRTDGYVLKVPICIRSPLNWKRWLRGWYL